MLTPSLCVNTHTLCLYWYGSVNLKLLVLSLLSEESSFPLWDSLKKHLCFLTKFWKDYAFPDYKCKIVCILHIILILRYLLWLEDWCMKPTKIKAPMFCFWNSGQTRVSSQSICFTLFVFCLKLVLSCHTSLVTPHVSSFSPSLSPLSFSALFPDSLPFVIDPCAEYLGIDWLLPCHWSSLSILNRFGHPQRCGRSVAEKGRSSSCSTAPGDKIRKEMCGGVKTKTKEVIWEDYKYFFVSHGVKRLTTFVSLKQNTETFCPFLSKY